MAIIVVGGSKRGVGKTTLVCALIGALTEYRWTARLKGLEWMTKLWLGAIF